LSVYPPLTNLTNDIIERDIHAQVTDDDVVNVLLYHYQYRISSCGQVFSTHRAHKLLQLQGVHAGLFLISQTTTKSPPLLMTHGRDCILQNFAYTYTL